MVQTADVGLFRSPLAGKTICFAGRFARFMQESLVQCLQTDGVNVVKEIDDSLDYLVLGSTGYVGQKKKAEQLNLKKGASIAIIDEPQLFALVTPSRAEMAQLLRAGEKGVERANLFTGSYPFIPYMPDMSGADLSGADLRKWSVCWGSQLQGLDLRGANLSYCTLGFTKCKLDGAKVDNATIPGIVDCSARDIDFSTAHLGQNLLRNDFTRCNFQAASIRYGDFTGSTLDHANLRATHVGKGTFSQVSLRGADLSMARLASAKLIDADLRGCNLSKAKLTGADLTGANVDGADFHGASLTGANLTNVDLSKAIGWNPDGTVSKAILGPSVQQWSQIAAKAKHLVTTIQLKDQARQIEVQLSVFANHVYASDTEPNDWHEPGKFSVQDALRRIADHWNEATPIPASVTVNGTNTGVTNQDLKGLAMAMWCELFGVGVPSEKELKQQKKAAKADQRSQDKAAHESRKTQIDEWVRILRDGPEGMQKWDDSLASIRRDLACKLDGIDLSKASLPGWRCGWMDCNDADFTEADLRKAEFSQSRLARTRFTHANCEKAVFQYASLKDAICPEGNFAGADLSQADLRGADFTGATLKDAQLAGAKFDETTRFPRGFKATLDMKWQGAGASPAIAQEVARMKSLKPLDIDAFMKRLEAGVEAAKLQKALSMLKADRFNLYAQVGDEHLVGIVKSQGDANLVYSCKLASDGIYGCCTQNLNVCGGLRGSLCKHLLVLIVGLTRAGDLDPNVIDTWVLASRGQKPALDKDAMSETFLRYKGAEAGEVDWRPTETIPEDYYAM